MKIYINLRTKEKTNSHTQAVLWYRAGANIVIYVNNKKVLTWFH